MCARLYPRDRRERGPRADLEAPPEAWDSAHGGCCAGPRLLPLVLSCWFAASCTFSRFALTRPSSPGGGLQREVIHSRPLPFPPIWPRAWPRVGSAWAHPPASLWPGCHLAGVLDQGGPVLPLAPSLRRLGPRPCRQTAGVQVLPSCSPGGLGPPTPVAPRPPHRGGCAGSEGSPCEDARRQCSVNISPTVMGGSAAVRTQE